MNDPQSIEISESENKRYGALINADKELLEDLIHDNLIYIHSILWVYLKQLFNKIFCFVTNIFWK